jgi:hypothetical protein
MLGHAGGGTDVEPRDHRGHDVLVSYSRADRDAVVALTEHLAAAGKRPWVDLEDIPPSAEWMAEIRAAIEAADGYLTVISPDLARVPGVLRGARARRRRGQARGAGAGPARPIPGRCARPWRG